MSSGAFRAAGLIASGEVRPDAEGVEAVTRGDLGSQIVFHWSGHVEGAVASRDLPELLEGLVEAAAARQAGAHQHPNFLQALYASAVPQTKDGAAH